MACLFGHKWNGCKCTKCGKTRNEGHELNFCTCRICGAKLNENHDWQPVENKCAERCSVCRKERKREHSYITVEGKCEEKCSRCGQTRQIPHKWQDGYCMVCGEKQADPEATKLINILKSDPNWEKRRDAGIALEKYKFGEVFDALIFAMKNDDSWVVRFKCAQTLGEMGDKRAVIPLIEALLDKTNTVVEYAGKALGKLKDERSIEPMLDVMRKFRGGDYMGMLGVIAGLGLMGDIAVPRLLELADSDIGNHVKRALAETGSPKAMGILVSGAKDDSQDGYYRALMIDGIGKIGGEAAIGELKSLLENASNPDVVNALLRNLEKLGVSKDQLGDAEKDAKIAAAKKLLEGLRSLRKGMTEDDADRLVGGANFGMGANQVHNTNFGSFQLLVSNGIVYDMLYTDGVIQKIEQFLLDNK